MERPPAKDAGFLAQSKAIDIENMRAAAHRLVANGQPTLEKISLEFQISGRTLQRRLMHYGFNYSEIVDQAQLELAERLLREPSMAIGDIGHQLGYADAGSFSRAFLRRTGISPRAFRNNLSR